MLPRAYPPHRKVRDKSAYANLASVRPHLKHVHQNTVPLGTQDLTFRCVVHHPCFLKLSNKLGHSGWQVLQRRKGCAFQNV